MAVRENLPIPADPDFSAEIGGLNQDDPVHYAQMNAILTRLLTNDVFLEKLASKMVEKTLIAHVLDSTNTSMVLGADQAPALTALLDTERERITKLNSDITGLNTKIGAKVAVVSFVKSSIPIAAGADFYAYIPIDIDTTDVIWAFPVLTDAPGDNCTKVNISTCVWQDKSKRIYVNGCNLASGTANISLAGVLIAIR